MSKRIRRKIEQIISLQKTAELVSWNLETGAPEKSIDTWSPTLGHLAGMSHRMTVDPEFGKLLKGTKPKNSLERKIVEHWLELHIETKRVPSRLAEELEEVTANSSNAWKDSVTFTEMLPHLEKVVALTKEWADCYEGEQYNSLIECYDPDFDKDYISSVFDPLKPRLIELRNQGESVNAEKLNISLDKNPALWNLAAQKLGFDMTRGMIGVTTHPFMMVFDKNDVRIAVNKDTDALNSFYGAVHEIGHALYEQNTADELVNTGLGCPFSTAIHESQSLFCEQFLGKSDLFWREAYEDFQQIVTAAVDWPRDKFVRHLRQFDKNNVIRLRATELDYGLHIMLRFELERELFSGGIEVRHMRDHFNELTLQYFGRYPSDDRREGVLQDTHWPSGMFGYFPSYLMGAMFAAQLWTKLSNERTVKDVITWLNNNIHVHGATRNYRDTLKVVTGNEKPDTNCYVNWLKQEFNIK